MAEKKKTGWDAAVEKYEPQRAQQATGGWAAAVQKYEPIQRTKIVSSPTVRPAVARQQTPVQQMPVQAPTQAEPTPGIHFDLNQTPYFQSTAPKSRLQQLAEETVQLAEETAQQRAFTPITPTTSYRDNSAFTRYEIPNAETSAFRKITPVEQPKEEPRHDFSKSDEQVMADRKQAAFQAGINWDELNALQRGAGTVAATVSGAGKQAAASALGVGAAIYNENTKSGQILAWQNADTTAREMLQRLKDGEDASDLEYRLKSQAAYYGGPEYADRLINYVREKAAAGEEDINIDDAEPIKDYIFSRQQENIQGLYNTMNNLSTSGAQDLQTAKYLNLIQSDFGDKLVDAGAFAVQSAVDASIAAALHLTGTSAAYIPFALRAFGGSYNEALTNMQNMGQVIGSDAATKTAQYGTAAAGIEVATEMLWGMAGAMGAVKGGALDDAVMQKIGGAVSKIATSEAGKKQLTKLSEFVLGGAFEGAEEVIGDLLNKVFHTAEMYGGETTWDDSAKELWDSFVGGALSGWMGSGARTVINPIVQTSNGSKIRKGAFTDFTGNNMTAAELIESAGAADENTSFNQTLQDLTRKYGESEDFSAVLEKASDQDLGRLYESYLDTMQEDYKSQQLVYDAIEETQARSVKQTERGRRLPTSLARNIAKNDLAMQTLADMGYEVNSDMSYKERIDAIRTGVEALASSATAFREAQDNNIYEQLGLDTSAKHQLESRLYEQTENNWQQSVDQRIADAEMQNVNAVRDAAQAINMGQTGLETLQANYDGRQDPAEYVNAMDQAYELGRAGGELNVSKLDTSVVNVGNLRNAFMAGRTDRISEQEATNAESGKEVRVRNSSQRNDGQSAVGQAGTLEGSAGQNQNRQIGYQQGQAGNARVSSAAISERSIAATGLKIVSNSADKDVSAAREYATSHGMNFVAWYGGSLWIDGVQSRGFYDPKTNTVYVRAGHALFTAEQIAKHETTHGQIRNGQIVLGDVDGKETVVGLNTVRDALVKELGPDKFSDLVDKYVEAYAGTGMSRQEVFEELICDAMAGMNEFVAQGHMEEAFRQQASMDATKAVTEENAANGERAGPAESRQGRYSADHYDPETAGIKEQIANKVDTLNDMTPVAAITVPTNIKTNREAAEWAIGFLKKTGYQVDRQGYGKIMFGPKDIRNGARYATNNAERAAFAAIPSVLKRGIEIGRHNDHKSRSVQTITFAAPVVLNDVRGNMAVVINSQGSHYKTHRIVMPDGTTFILSDETKKEDLQRSRGVADNSSLAETTRSSANNVAEDNGVVKQNISSAGTSLNQVPALHKDSRIEWGDTNIDIGAGAYEAATEYLKDKGVTNLKWDPYNQPESVNRATLKYLQDGNKADTATCANVLNVIAEKDARLNVILQAAKSIGSDGKAYFTVYEGDGSGVGKETTKGWQNNLKTREYADEIRTYFNDVQVKGKLIVASNPKANLPQAAWETKPGTATKFSMDLPVEETKNLVALHNLSEDKLMKSLKLGGFPMPSIAVTKVSIPHTHFGDITLVMNKNAVDPEADSRNTVYSADAWTPTFPNVEYEANPKAKKKIRDLFYDLERKYGRDVSDALYGYGNYLDDQLNRYGGIEGILALEENNTNMMKAYLKSQGKAIPANVIRETVETISDDTVQLYDSMLKSLGDASKDLDTYMNPAAARKWFGEHESDIKAGYEEYLLSSGISQEDIDSFFEHESWGQLYAQAKKARKYQIGGRETRKTETDYQATMDAIRGAVDKKSYMEWLHDLFDDAVSSSGIPNGMDPYTRSGNRRPFSQTHFPVTLNNIVRSMRSQNGGDTQNVFGFSGVKTLRADMAKRFESVADMHNEEWKLQHLTDEEANAITDSLQNRLTDIVMRIVDTKQKTWSSNSFMDADTVGGFISSATNSKNITVDSILNKFKGSGYKVDRKTATEIRDLLFDISQMPTNLFEAKPERAVGFDEVLAAVVPSGTSEKLINELKSAGVKNILEYESGNDEDRLKKVNSVEGSRFSRELDIFLQEQYPEYRTDKENLRLAEEGIKELEEGAERISSSGREVDLDRRGRENTSGIRTLGRGITDSFIRKGQVNLNGQRVKSTEDLARICQIFRNPKFETLRYFYVRKGKIVGIDAISCRLPGLALAETDSFKAEDIAKKMSRVKADGYFIMHNHPSGAVEPSRDDINTTGSMVEKLKKTSPATFLGHIIIDHEIYSQIDVDTNNRTATVEENKAISGQQSLDLLLTPSIDNKNLGKTVLNPAAVAAVGKDVASGAGFSAVIYADTKGKIRQVQEVSDKALKNNKQISGYIRNQRIDSGAGMAFVYTNDQAVYDAMRELYRNDILTEVVLDAPNKNIESMHRNENQIPNMTIGISDSDLSSRAKVNETTEEYQGKASRELGTSELYEQNRQLRSDLSEMRRQLEQKTKSRDYWRGQTKTTEGRRLRQDDVEKLARNIIKANDSEADVSSAAKKLKELGEYLLNSKEDMDALYDNARMMAYEAAHDILSQAKVLNTKGGEEFYQDFRDYLRNNKIYVAPSVRNELAPDGWNEFRKSLFGTMTLTADSSKGTTIDKVYQDMRQLFGDWLLPEDISNEADQLLQILEVARTYEPVYENINSFDMAEAVEYTANEILGRILSDEIRDTQPTYADRMEKRLEKQKAKSQAALKRVRADRDQRIADLKQHYQNVAKDRREKRINSEKRTRLLNIMRRLTNMKLNRVQRALLDQYIGEMDLVSKSLTGKTIHDLQGLRTWYNAYKEKMGDDFIPDKAIEKKLERLSQKHIKDLTQEEVADLTMILLNFENEIRTADKLIESQIKADTYAAGQQVIEDIKNSRGRTGFLNKYISTETATPEREAHRLTGYNDTDPLYVATKELSAGQRKALDYQMRAEDLFDEWVNNRSFIRRIAGKHAQEIEVPAIVDGERTKVVITPAMRMSLYLHEKNDDNMTHITKGGVSIPDMKLYKKGKIEKAYEQATLAVFTRGMIREIASKMSPEEKAFADAVYRYYNGMSRDAINEVSELLKGYSLAGVENYYPIDTDGTFLSKEFDAIKRDGSIEGMGMLKERIQGATTPIMLYDMNDTLAKSIQQHSKYYGLAIPVRNFQKLYNANAFANREIDYEYDPLDRTDWRYDTSVIKTLQREWGSAATRYLEKMIADVSNGTGLKRDVWGELMSRARSRYAGAVLTTNASVAFKQAASYPTAAAVVGYGPLMKALKDRNTKVDLELVKKYTPLLDYRMKGFSTTELGDIGKEGRHIPKALNWIQAMDVWTTRKLWLAAEYYVRENQDLKPGSPAYLKEVATIYNRIIEETQPNYTMIQRPQILRSDSDLTRALNMFRTQPFQNFNILYDAFWNLEAKTRQYKVAGTEDALNKLKEARKGFARAVSSQAVSAFVFALMQFAWDAFRGKDKKYRDEDGELKLESWLKGIGINVLSSVGGMVPFGGYVVELGEAAADAISKALDHGAIFDQTFYGLSENASDAWNDMGKAVISLITKTTNALGGKASTETTIRGVVDAIGDVGQFFGIPANNAVKTAQAIARNVFLATDGQYIGGYEALRVTTDPAKYTSDYYDLLYKAYTNDPAAYATIKKMMLNDNQTKNGSDVFTEEKINNAMRDRKKAQMDRDAAYKAQYEAITSNRLWDQADAKQKDAAMNRLTQYYMQTVGLGNDTGADLEAKIAGGEQYGLTSAEYILYKLALSMADEDGNGSYKNEEVTNAINMVPGLSNQEKAYLWDAQGKNAKSNPWK